MLMSRYERRAFGVAMGMLRNPDDAMDVVQEAFIRVYKHLPNYQSDCAFFTWLYRITVNAATDHLSRAGTRKLRLVEDTAVFERGDQEDSSPTASLEAEELAQITRAIVDQLPEKFRTILVLREFEGLSYTEIADVLEIQLGTVESRLFRARQRFKDALTRQHPELLPIAGAGSPPRGGKR